MFSASEMSTRGREQRLLIECFQLFILEMYQFWSGGRWHDSTGFDVFSLSFLSADAFCSSSVTSWGLPTTSADTVRLSRLVLSCLRLVFGHRQLKQVWDATDTPTTPREGSAASSREEDPGCEHRGSCFRWWFSPFGVFFWVFEWICSETVSNILLPFICSHQYHV